MAKSLQEIGVKIGKFASDCKPFIAEIEKRYANGETFTREEYRLLGVARKLKTLGELVKAIQIEAVS